MSNVCSDAADYCKSCYDAHDLNSSNHTSRASGEELRAWEPFLRLSGERKGWEKDACIWVRNYFFDELSAWMHFRQSVVPQRLELKELLNSLKEYASVLAYVSSVHFHSIRLISL